MKLRRQRKETADEWSHLSPVEGAYPRIFDAKSQERVKDACRHAIRLVKHHGLNARSYYQLQHAQHGTPAAIRNTAGQIGRTLYSMLNAQLPRAAAMLNASESRPNRRTMLSRMSIEWHEDSIPTESVTISVVIPTKNAGADFRSLLSTLRHQQGFKNIDIVIVDSGSTDQTLNIARESGVDIIEIPPEDFSHSYARNLGAERSRGDYLLFIVQDALPVSLTWLRDLYEPIKSAGVVASSCAECPREDADLLYRAGCWNHYRFLNVQNQDRILEKPAGNDYASLRTNANVSNIACMIARETFLKYKFRGNYAEDLDLGLRLIRDGCKMALLSSTRVIHSHNRSAFYHLKRGYVDNLLLISVFSEYQTHVVEAGELIDDIVFLYEGLRQLLNNELGPLLKSCSIDTLSELVITGLKSVASRSYPVKVTFEKDCRIDEDFQSFIENLYEQHYTQRVARIPYRGFLVESFRSFVTTNILEYMRGIYEVIDEHLVDDFRQCLFKAFAMLCGVHLAIGVGRGTDTTRETLQAICGNLEQSI